MVTVGLRLGDWREALLDVKHVDTMLTDPPFSARTHEGQRSVFEDFRMDVSQIGYAGITPAYCNEFVAAWSGRVRYWWVIFGDHLSCAWWLEALDRADLQTFAPVPWIRHAGPRVTGDGPKSGAEYLAVARTRGKWATSPPWGSLPGWYEATTAHLAREALGGFVGQKPEGLMRALVRDYSRPGWTVCDPHAGTGTTLVAARIEGRQAIGAERDPETHRMATQRLAQPYTVPLFGSG